MEQIGRRAAIARIAGASTAAISAQKRPAAATVRGSILEAAVFAPYVRFFNAMVPEEVRNYVPNASAWDWMEANIPLFTCPDANVELTYYYRWWAYRKHIKKTPAGFIITEFLKPVKHATDYNALSCAFGHHVAEGRWLHTREYVDEYARFLLTSGPNGGLHPKFHQFSGWAAAALYDRWLVDANTSFLTALFDALVLDYQTWEQERMLQSGLFWQRDVADGMEESISGGRKSRNIRPSINSYMYGNAMALAAIAKLRNDARLASEYTRKARNLRRLVQDQLWDKSAQFFETRLESGTLAGVREAIGFTPWYFDLPEQGCGYEEAWRQLLDREGFYAPYGPTTAEQRAAGFQIAYSGDDCQWNGPSWPFATTITLKALANVLNRYPQNAVSKQDYFETFLIYARSHRLVLPDGRTIPWVDEDLNPFTGEWLARARKIAKGTFYGRGDHYNHSGFADLVITGVAGLRPRADSIIEVNPLLPEGKWDWFCVDRIPYHGHNLAILWDRNGTKFGRGSGLQVLLDGHVVGRADRLTRIEVS